MVKVEMPWADWEILLMYLEVSMESFKGPLIEDIFSNIESQVYRQEY